MARPWFKMDVEYPDNPKIAERSDAAFRLHVTAIAYCARVKTDGFIGRQAMARMGSAKAIRELKTAGLLHDCKGPRGEAGFLLHDYLTHQTSASAIEDKAQAKSRGGSYGMHVRWHVNRDAPDPSCALCVEAGLAQPP